ncbi:MAG: TIGR00282 family metallophosphoesterase [Clostridia bacterium]|nr:TIGR00282 family metallophosphoesterase [Clostridia bacterium]
MRLLAVGDVFGECGVEFVSMALRGIREDENIDFCIANAENTSGTGITLSDYDKLYDAGVDAFTLGNHTFGKKDVFRLFERETNIVRPANYPDGTPGCGSAVLKCGDKKIGILNIMGRIDIAVSLDCPFRAADRELKNLKDRCDFVVVDFHAEATSEKKAMMYYLDSRVSVLFGTHTHVQTADEIVTKNGMGYITDLGMTGAEDSILGVKKEIIMRRFINALPQKFEYAYGRAALCGAVFEIDDTTNKCISVKRICVR